MHSTRMLMYGSEWTLRSDCWFRVTRVRKKDGSLSVGDRPLPSCRAHPRLICMVVSKCVRMRIRTEDPGSAGLFNKPADHENSSALVIVNLIRIINISRGCFDVSGSFHALWQCLSPVVGLGSNRLDSTNDGSHNVVRRKEDHGS